MGILDELKQQAEKQQNGPAKEATPQDADVFYREQVQARMVGAFKFLTELVDQLTTLNLDTRVDYPFRPDDKPVTLLQQGYKVYSDHITEPRQITLACSGVLVNPTTYDVTDRAAVLRQSDLLDRFNFKYEKQEQKDARQIVIGAKFRLAGPLPLKAVLQFDDYKQIIKLFMTNFAGPGTSQYNIELEKLDEQFLDDLAKYILRKKDELFRIELSDEVRAKLRKKLQEEQQLREAELRAAEEARQAEEARRKQHSTKEQIKKAVSAQKEQLKKVVGEQLEQKKEKLKDMFNKVKKQANAVLTPAPKQAAPANPPAAGAPVPPAAQPAKAPAPRNPTPEQLAAKTMPPTAPVRQAAMPKQSAETKPNAPAAVPPTAKPQPRQTQATPAARPATVPPKQSVAGKPKAPAAAAPATTRPPTNQAAVAPAARSPMAPPQQADENKPKVPAAAIPPAAEIQSSRAEGAPPAQNTASVQDKPAGQTASAEQAQRTKAPPKVYTAPPGNPFLKPEPPVAADSGEAPAPPVMSHDKPEVSETAAASSADPAATADALEEHLARIIERQSGNSQLKIQRTPAQKASQTPASLADADLLEAEAGKANPFLQPSGPEEDTPAADQGQKHFLRPGELNTPLSELLPLAEQKKRVEQVHTPEEQVQQHPATQPEALDLDLSVNNDPSDDEPAKDPS